MKTLTKNTLLVACSLLLLSASCKKTKTGLGALPPATQQGKKTFGCLINGKAFVAQTSPFSFKPAVSCGYNGFDFNVSGRDNKTDPNKLFSIKIYTNKIDIQEGFIYQLQNQKDNGAFAEYDILDETLKFNTHTSITGELTITKFDKINGIASGTFWFDAENKQGEKVKGREGRFDAKINQ